MKRAQRSLLIGAAGGLAFALLFSASFLFAFHDPTPHRLPVAVVAPAPVIAKLEAGLAASAPGAFVLRGYPSGPAARTALIHRRVDGALVLGPVRAELLVAEAGGTASAQTLAQAFTAALSATGEHLRVYDVAPLPVGNREGLSVFFLVLSMLLPSLAVGALSSIATRDPMVTAPVQAMVLVAFAVVLGALGATVADALTGALVGHYPAMFAVAALFSLAVAAPTAALARIHTAGTALATLTFVVVGLPATGGPVGLSPFQPAFFRAFNPALPPTAAIPALTNVSYFNGSATSEDLVILAVWAAAGLLVLLLTGAFQRRHRQHLVVAPVSGQGAPA